MTSFEIAFGDIVVFAFTIPVGVFILEAIARSTKTMNRIKLGDKVRSTVSGFSGTVTAICHYLYNESQYCVKQNALVNGDEKVCWFSIGELTTAPECEMGECDK